MNEHLVRPHPAPLTPAGVAQLHADATNWRALLIELTDRGFDNMTLEDIVAVFPNFREMACRRKRRRESRHSASEPTRRT